MKIRFDDTFKKGYEYEIVDTIPAGFYVWNIGENMGTDEYIPLAEDLKPEDKDDYRINQDTLKAIRLAPELVEILREASCYGVSSKKVAEKVLRRQPKSKMAMRKKELAEKAFPIFERLQ